MANASTRYGNVFLVRHGRTPLNAAGLLRGHLDPPLDEVGQREAAALADVFAATPIALIVSSPLRRARETAEPIAGVTGAPVQCNDAFIDRDYGPWAGHDRIEVEARYGSVNRAPEIEPFGQVVSRALVELRALAGGVDSLLVVAHDVVNRALLARFAANTPDDSDAIPQRTGCWNRLEHRDGKWLATVIDAVPGDGQTPT
jgi:broad specificity phosphatase PhoE